MIMAGNKRGARDVCTCLEPEIHHPWAFKDTIWGENNFLLSLDAYNT